MPYRPSPHRVADRRAAGFTLAELLVVVAIIAVLVAVAVPVFSSAMGNTEEAVCAANRRSVKSLYTNAWLLNPDAKPQQDLFGDCVAQLKKQNDGVLCPNDGTYSATFASDGAVIITCSIHGLSMEDELNSWFANNPWNGKTDSTKREDYAKENKLDEWPSVKGTDGVTRYLQFKSYANSSDTVFLYVGPEKRITGGGGQWKAKYLCDSTGLYGEPGVWYEIKTQDGKSVGKDGGWVSTDPKNPEEAKKKLRNLLEENKDNKVVLEGDAFKPA